jgi:hypothetical protein
LEAREEHKLKNRPEPSSSDQSDQSQASNDELKKVSNQKRKKRILVKSDSEEVFIKYSFHSSVIQLVFVVEI